jgi:copper chaperone CopZ
MRVIVGAVVVAILNLQVLQSVSLWLAQLRQSDAYIPIINFHWKDLSNQLDPSKYQRLVFGIILVLMMIYRPAGILPAARRKRELKRELGEVQGVAKVDGDPVTKEISVTWDAPATLDKIKATLKEINFPAAG